MADTDRRSTDEVRQPEPPLPEESGLTLEEYLAMQQAIGHPTRFRILRTLVANDELSAAERKSAVERRSPQLPSPSRRTGRRWARRQAPATDR